ncbi:MAG: 30S ribosomal protein S6 [Anaerolineae bacterium]|nr:30S ribosomal protein S6 [Anaerolineae bacterium]MCX8066927.1 30S ribosomal protein S6 [Anaerolineae bacterium]MDW7991175.1 30S ribosomal protein S6 [Anaerolineae bacterium]
MRRYELTYIVHPQVDQAGLEAVIADVRNLVESNGGVVHKVEPWGLRRLAYPIRKVREGYYVLMDIGLNAPKVAELERALKLREPILRYLFVRTDEGEEE